MMKRFFVLGVLTMQLFTTVVAQQKTNPEDIKEKMQWFADAKLGIFIHWGIYAVKGVDESWSFHNRKISYADYMQQMKGFTAANYNPQAWADLIKESGARYAVMTTKHHDGVALWDTKFSKLTVAKGTPAKRDVLTPLYAALRKDGIKCGAYFSLLDWSHPDYPGFLKDSARYDMKQHPEKWQRFLQFNNGQLTELINKFNPDLWWFDGDWEQSAEERKAADIKNQLISHNPNTIENGRLQGYGDYDTPEQNFPITRPHFHWWELCMTINNNWGYQPQVKNLKTPFEIISIFADAVSNGGNLLLDIGPKEDGTIPEEQVHVLKELGAWNKRNGAASFGTIGGIPMGHFYGPTTLSKDSTTLYLFLPGRMSGQVMLKGLMNKIESITVLGNGTQLQHKIVGKISWSAVPGLVYIDVPENVLDKYMTVLEVKLDKRIKLYRGQGGFLTNED